MRRPLLLACVLFASTACRDRHVAEQMPAPSASSSVTKLTGATFTSKAVVDRDARVALPPTGTLLHPHAFAHGGLLTQFHVCRFDVAAPPIVHAEPARARASHAAAPDGTIWILDHEAKLRHYTNRNPEGCELVLDRSFGKGGVLELPRESGTFTSVMVDAKNVVWLTSGTRTVRLENGNPTPGPSGFYRTQATTSMALTDGEATAGGVYKGRKIRELTGFDPKAPESSRPTLLGFFGDEVVVSGADVVDGKKVDRIGLFRADGSLRLKLGKDKGEEAVGDAKSATSCGEDLCIFSEFFARKVQRFRRDGTFVATMVLDIMHLRDTTFTSGGDGGLWISGAVPGQGKNDYAGIVLRAHTKPMPAGDLPTLDHEPTKLEGPIRGEIRGRPFIGSKVEIANRSGDWRLAVTDGAGNTLTTSFATPGIPRAGLVSLVQPGDKSVSANAFLPGTTTKGMSSDFVTSVKRHRVEITRWDVKPFDKAAKSSQEAGYASGKIYLSVPAEGSNGKREDSFCAGAFEDAIVTYWEDPSTPRK